MFGWLGFDRTEFGRVRGGGSRGVLIVAGPDQRGGADEVAAVDEKVPMAGEAAELLHFGEGERFVLEQLVRGKWVVAHLPLVIVPDDGRATKALENSDLDLLRSECDELIEAAREAGHVLAGKSDDQIGVHMDAGFAVQELEVLGEAIVILPAFDAGADLRIETLDADFELERAGRKLGDDVAQAIGQAIGNHLEMEEVAGGVAGEAEFEDGFAGVEIEIEGAVDKFEMFDAALHETIERGEEFFEVERAHGNFERRETEFAGEGAAARGFDIDDAVGDVSVIVEVVRKREVFENGEFGWNDFAFRRSAIEESAADFGKFEIGFAGDDVVGGLADGLKFGFEADFGSAEDDGDVGSDAFEDVDDFGGELGVPDVNAEADDFWVSGEKDFGDVVGALVQVEFDNAGAVLQFSEIRQEVAQAERGVNIFRIERAEDNVRHRSAV